MSHHGLHSSFSSPSIWRLSPGSFRLQFSGAALKSSEKWRRPRSLKSPFLRRKTGIRRSKSLPPAPRRLSHLCSPHSPIPVLRSKCPTSIVFVPLFNLGQRGGNLSWVAKIHAAISSQLAAKANLLSKVQPIIQPQFPLHCNLLQGRILGRLGKRARLAANRLEGEFGPSFAVIC